jgi:hypothetical protein
LSQKRTPVFSKADTFHLNARLTGADHLLYTAIALMIKPGNHHLSMPDAIHLFHVIYWLPNGLICNQLV